MYVFVYVGETFLVLVFILLRYSWLWVGVSVNTGVVGSFYVCVLMVQLFVASMVDLYVIDCYQEIAIFTCFVLVYCVEMHVSLIFVLTYELEGDVL